MYWVSLLENKHYHDLNPRLYGHEDCAPGQSFGFVVRDFWMLYRVDSGKGVFYSDEQRFDIHSEQLFLIRPGASTKIQADRQQPWMFHWLGFDGRLAERFYELPLVLDMQTDLFDNMDRLEEYDKNKEEYLMSQMLLLFCQLFPGDTDTPRVRQIKQYLYAHCMERNPIEAMAQEMNLDRHYLSRLYREQTGKTMQQYVTEVRFRRAHALLSQGYSCLWTAEQLGYGDLASFSRAFKQVYGYPPSKLKQ